MKTPVCMTISSVPLLFCSLSAPSASPLRQDMLCMISYVSHDFLEPRGPCAPIPYPYLFPDLSTISFHFISLSSDHIDMPLLLYCPLTYDSYSTMPFICLHDCHCTSCMTYTYTLPHLILSHSIILLTDLIHQENIIFLGK